MGFPKTDGFGSIMVVVDRFSKYGTFILAIKKCPTQKAARLFLKHVMKYWGVPQSIVNDRDGWFTWRFWTELFRLLGSNLNFSTSVHPKTDRKGECFVRDIFTALCERLTARLAQVARCGPIVVQFVEE